MQPSGVGSAFGLQRVQQLAIEFGALARTQTCEYPLAKPVMVDREQPSFFALAGSNQL